MTLPTRVGASLLLIALAAAGAAAQTIAWRRWDPGLAEAARTKRFVLVDVKTSWCGWCRKMDREVYARADVRRALDAAFVPVQLDAESKAPAELLGRTANERAVAQHFGVTGYPTTIFLRADGEHLANVPGYIPPERFLLLLRYVGEGHMDRGLAWERWVEQNQAER